MTDRPPYLYENLLLAATRAKRIRWGASEGDRRAVKRLKDGSGASGSDLLAALLAQSGDAYTPAADLKAKWLAAGASYDAFKGTLLAFRRQGYVDEVGIERDSGGVMRGSYRLRGDYFEKREARQRKGARRAFEDIYGVD